MYFDRDDAPSAAEAARDEAERQCSLNGHVLDEDEDGEVVCYRCGERAIYGAEEPPVEDEPEPTEDDLLAWHLADVEAIRRSDLGKDAA